jgi:hypothetical protein
MYFNRALLQHAGVLGMQKAYDREYILYATFQVRKHILARVVIKSNADGNLTMESQMEMYAFKTAASDRAQQFSGIESAVDACDGLNIYKVLRQLCLINYGKHGSLSYEEAHKVSGGLVLSRTCVC